MQACCHIWRETRKNLGLHFFNASCPTPSLQTPRPPFSFAFINKTNGEKPPFKLQPGNTGFASANILVWAFSFKDNYQDEALVSSFVYPWQFVSSYDK